MSTISCQTLRVLHLRQSLLFFFFFLSSSILLLLRKIAVYESICLNFFFAACNLVKSQSTKKLRGAEGKKETHKESQCECVTEKRINKKYKYNKK